MLLRDVLLALKVIDFEGNQHSLLLIALHQSDEELDELLVVNTLITIRIDLGYDPLTQQFRQVKVDLGRFKGQIVPTPRLL